MFRGLAIVAFLLSGCTQPLPPGGGGPSNAPPPAPRVTLIGTYSLVALNGQPVQPGITLILTNESSFSGRAPCNRYFGDYSAGNDFSFDFPQVGATRQACPALSLERDYFSALDTVRQYRPGREGDTLALLNASGRTVANYVSTAQTAPPAAQINLDGNWTITAARVNGVLTPNPGPSGTGISFSQARREFNAGLGCNSASGPYTLNGNELDFGAIAVTTRQCFAAAPLEGPILSAFDLVRTAARTPSGIDLLDPNGQPLIRLAR